MVTAAELKAARVAMYTRDREGVQRVLDLLKREGGSMTRAQLDEARAQGFDVVGIIVRDAPPRIIKGRGVARRVTSALKGRA